MFEPIFPGMDPFIEEQRPWQEFHNALVSRIWEELSRLLAPQYNVVSESYVSLQLRPDVSVWRGRPDAEPLETSSLPTADATRTITPTIYEVDDQLRIEIRGADGRLVTVVELLSPSNKDQHRSRYLANRDAVLSSDASLVEIDLLLHGKRTEPDFIKQGYVMLVARSHPDRPHSGDVYEFTLQDAIPVIPVPLTNGDPDVPLNLPELVKNLYIAARYRLQLDYSREISATLLPQTRAWIAAQLKGI
jgi:hypothetical protein